VNGAICTDRANCSLCLFRVFKITVAFFQDRFKELLVGQHGSGYVCQDSACEICNKDHPELTTCITCGKATGKERAGIIGIEICQYHKRQSCRNEYGPVKKCGCPAHVRLHLLCSTKCKDQAPFQEFREKKLGDSTKEDLVIVPEKGPMFTIQHYFPESESGSESEVGGGGGEAKVETSEAPKTSGQSGNATTGEGLCVVCFQPGSKFCGRCKKIRYCGRECQLLHWKVHKPECNPPTPK
jgi:hypothetical protein